LQELRELQLVDHTEDGFGYTVWGESLGEQLLRLSQWSEEWNKDLDA